MIRYFGEIFSGLWSLLVGMKLTAKFGLSPSVTCHYPFQTLPITPNFRGHTDLVIDEDSASDKCIVCMMCQNACPSQCISLAGEKPEGSKKKVLTEYRLDFTKCSLCGNCVEVCPTGALEYSQEYQLAGFSRHDFHYDLLGRLRERVRSQGLQPKPKAPAAEAGEAQAGPRKARPKAQEAAGDPAQPEGATAPPPGEPKEPAS